MPKRSRYTEQSVLEPKKSQLEEISCLGVVLIFLAKKDVCSLFYCNKIFTLKCFKDICQKHKWNISQTQMPKNLNLNWIKRVSVFFNDENESNIIEFLSKLKYIQYIETSGTKSHKIKIESLPETINKWKCHKNTSYINIQSLPPKLQYFSNLSFMELKFPLLKLQNGIFPNSLTSLTFCCMTKLQNGILPKSLHYLDIKCIESTLEDGFIPQSVRNLRFTSTSIVIIDSNSLPKKLTTLRLKARRNSAFSPDFFLPQTLIKICLSSAFKQQSFDSLPPQLQSLSYFDSGLFFMKLENRIFPLSLTELEGFNNELMTLLPLDMLPNFKQLISLKCSNINSMAIEHLDCDKLVSLTINYCAQDISFARLKGLVTLSIGFNLDTAVSVYGLESLTNLKTLEIKCQFRQHLFKIIGKYPKNLTDLTLGITNMKNISYLTKLESLKLKSKNKIEILNVNHFPKKIKILHIDAKTIIWPTENNNIFPKSLQKLTLNCESQRRKPFLQEAPLLTELSLSTCFLRFNLFQLVPETVLKLYLPRDMINFRHEKINNAVVLYHNE